MNSSAYTSEFSSEDSFQSDSDFEDLDENIAYESGRVLLNDDDEEQIGYRKKSWHARMIKRYHRKLLKTKCGRSIRRLRKKIASWGISVFLYEWYNGLYNGLIMLLIGIANLITIPYIHYYESLQDLAKLKFIVSLQLGISFIYLVDFLLMLIIFGFKITLFKRSWALRMEVILMIGMLQFVEEISSLYTIDHLNHDAKAKTMEITQWAWLFDFI